MVVNEDDTYEITETLDVEFTAPSHGIYVSIPRKTRLDRDGQLSQYNAAVKGFRMLSGQPFNEEKDGDAYLFRIGDPDKYADTETHYEYTYIYDTRGDHFKGGDEERSRILEERLAMYKQIHNICGYMWFSLNDYRTHCGEEGADKLRRRVHGSTDLYGNEKPSYRLLCKLQKG